MLRSYRSIILTLAGLVLIGAGEPPKGNAQTQDSQTAAEIKSAANSIASAIAQAAKPVEKDGGCKEGKERRSSDLCAQWKAADAAADAAQYAFWTLLISAIGTSLLVWTLWETRETSRRELRAYLSFGKWQISFDDDKMTMTISAQLQNNGHTPAYDCKSFLTVCVLPDGYMPKSVEAFGGAKLCPCGTIQSADEGKNIPVDIEMDERNIELHNQGKLAIWLLSRAEYKDVFGRTQIEQTTHFCGGSVAREGKMVPTDLFAIHT